MKRFLLFLLLLIGAHTTSIFGMKNIEKKCNLCWITDNTVESLPCHQEHTFHTACLRDWIASNPTNKKCFFCKTSLPKEIENNMSFMQILRYSKNLFLRHEDTKYTVHIILCILFNYYLRHKI